MRELRSGVRRGRSAATVGEEEVERNEIVNRRKRTTIKKRKQPEVDDHNNANQVTATMRESDVVETDGNCANPIIIEEEEEEDENVRGMPNLHQDIMLNILVRLPVKSILRFRCVSKAWCKLLKEPQFVKDHLNHAAQVNKFSVMMLLYDSVYFCRLDTDTYTLAYDPYSSTLSKSVRVDFPSRSEGQGIQIWGTCNGLVCGNLFAYSDVILWNPATHEFKKVPSGPVESASYYTYLKYAFGYDDEIDDYKVVSFVGFDDGIHCEVQVYTLKTNSWRRAEDIPYEFCGGVRLDMAQVSVNGATHWLPSTQSVIASFSFKDERIRKMHLPSCCDQYDGTKLSSLGGFLCFYGSIGDRTDVWEMKEYGVTESWAKLFTFNQGTTFRYCMECTPLQFVNNGEVLIGYDTDVGYHLDLYDIKRGTSIHLKAIGKGENFYHATSFLYVESLVTLNSGTYGGLPEMEDSEVDARTINLDSINSSAHVGGVESGDLEDDGSEEEEEEEENEIAERFPLSPKSVSPRKCCEKCMESESRKLELEYKKLNFKICVREDQHMSMDTSKMNALQLEWWQLRATQIVEKCRGSGSSIGDVNDGKEENGVRNDVKQVEDFQTKRRKQR